MSAAHQAPHNDLSMDDFVHFVLLGPLAGLLAIIGLVTAYILVDPRVRFSDKLVEMGLRTFFNK